MANNNRQSGSALIVVLGLLAVVMFMAIAFSISMRTERSGTTNLRHSLSAKQTMQTAISQVMESIDRSFGDPSTNTPVAYWDPPYLTSWKTYPYYTNGVVSSVDDRPTNAKVLTQEISRHLTPSQLALAKNAKVDWVPMKSGVDATRTSGGRPSEDKVVGRYAFIALNTTGLLDMNLAGGGALAQRLIDSGTNAANFQITGSTFLTANPTFVTKRNANGGFTSYADLWRVLGAPDYIANPASVISSGGSKPFEIKPDLFNTFSTSVEDLAPDGAMKIPLIVPTDDAAKKKYAARALAAFKKMFDENKDTAIYNNSKLPDMTRAQLATQALVDYLDVDAVSSGGIDPEALPGSDPLDYPCTEPVPMVTFAFAYFDVPADNDAKVVKTAAADASTWRKVYDVTFTLAVEAQYLNDKVPANLAGKSYTLKTDYVMTDFSDVYDLLWSDPTGWEIVGDLGSWEMGTKSESKVIASSPERISATVEKTFTVKAKPITWDNSTTPPTVTSWHKFSKLEESLPNESLRTRVRISAEVSSGAAVQKVPAPKLKAFSGVIDGNINPSKDYYITVQPALYHNPAERNVRDAGGAERFEWGWALCVDPRFAYNTESFIDVETDYAYWLYDDFARQYSQAGGDPGYRRLAQALVQAELDGEIYIGAEYGNFVINNILLNKTETKANLVQMITSLSGNKGMVPDSYHAYKNNGDMFLKLDQVQPMIQYRVANAPMITSGELGSLVVGPWETLSLFSVFRPDNKNNFHRAVDYFGVGEARFPTTTDIGASDITAIDKEHFPAVHSGRVNLNPPRIVQFKDEDARDAFLGDTDSNVVKSNYEPMVAVLTGAGIGFDSATKKPKELSRSLAVEIAQAFYEEADLDNDLLVRKVSDFGGLRNVAGDENPVLRVLQANEGVLGIECDAHREALIANTIGGFTTRGQTYTVILRADAYSPRYGSDSAGDGTTLASTHALVELWRDPEPCRRPDGKLFPLNTETPTHNWYIRSVRWF